MASSVSWHALFARARFSGDLEVSHDAKEKTFEVRLPVARPSDS